MSCCVTKKICPIMRAAKDVFIEMVEDRPWVWSMVVFSFFFFLGRHGFSCPCKKKK